MGSEVVLMQVIRTQLLRRGEGKDRGDPVRIITQYWSTEGYLLAEVDPWLQAHPVTMPTAAMREVKE
jgi:hypothetical protein